METLAASSLDQTHQGKRQCGDDLEVEPMGEDPVVDTVNENAVEDHCQPTRSLGHPVVNLTQIMDVQPSIDDGVTVVPPEPPDLSPGPAHKVNGAVIRRLSYPVSTGKHALRQQARRRRRNTSIAAGNSPPITRVTMKSVAATSPNPASQSLHPAVSPPASLSPTLSKPLEKTNVFTAVTTPSPPTSRSGSKATHSPSQGTAGSRSAAKGSATSSHPVAGTRVSSRIANNAAANSGLHSASSSMQPSMPQTGANANALSSGTQASRVVRVPASQSSPSARDASSPSMTTMQTYLAAIPGFKPRKRSQRKLSAAAQLAQTKEGNVDLETPDSILTSVNLRALLNKHTFGSLPPAYQHRLIKLLPMVDQSVGADDTLKVIPTGLNNEFFGRACESWRCRLGEGEFTHDNQVKLKVEAERERTKLDPWKVAHFEPLWGVKQGWCSTEGETSSSNPPSPLGGSVSMSPPQESHTTPAFTSSFSDVHISQLTKVLEHIATRNERRTQRRAQRRAERRKQRERELAEELSRCSASQSSSINPSANSLLGLPSASPATQTPSLAAVTPVTLPHVPSSSPLPPNSLSLFTSSSLPLHASKNNLTEVTSGAVFSAEEKLPLQSHVVNVESGVLSKDILKRKDGLALTTTTPSKKIRVSNADVTNSFVAKPGPTSAPAQILTTPVSCQNEAPRTTRVPTTSVTVTPKIVSSSVSINNLPPVATGAPGVPIKPTAVMVVSAPSSVGSTVVVTNPRMSPAPRISPVTRVSPGPSPSPSRLSPVVQVVSPSLSLAPSQSPPASRTVVVAGQARPVEVSSSATPVSHMANTVVQALPTSSVASLTSRVKPVRTPQGLSGAGTIALKVTRSRPPGGVNIQRSYEIVQAVIANSPNRDQLQAQLKTPAALLADVKPSTSGQTVVSPAVSSGNTVVTNPVNSQVVVQSSPQNQVQTITVVKAVATTSSNSTSSTSPVQGAQLITSGPRMVRQVALSVSGAAGTTVMPPIAGTPGTMVLRQMVTPQSLSTPSQHEVCEGSMAPPTATSRPITILRPTTGGKQIVVQTVPVSSLQVLRLKNISNVNGEGITSSDSQQPPRAASAPPNKSGVMVALAPRPSSVGPRIVVQTSSAQGSPATILTSAGQHFLSEGDPSPGVSSCDSDQLVTTRAGASQSSDTSSESIQENQVESLAPATSAAPMQLNANCTGPGTGPVPGSGNVPAVTTVSSVVNSFQNLNNNPSMPPQSVQHQHPQHPIVSQHPSMPVRPNMRMMMNNIPHMNNMQTLNNMQPMNNVAQMNAMPGMNGMASMNMQGNPTNQGMHAMPPQIKGDNNEDGCPCNMKAMIMCMKCGAFCHHDCIGPARLCVACLIR
ncbi:polycomb protein Asx-like isoform X1 [Penaeus chinensis]|uniref:polycomb protein Asx-like isoform X1 n=1 Tax=Penaeus chinensis TaxID=139456 RepID=UPI001FB67A02|nr:polycomb protein Asx-like isoform X1 [Penaeus chinensis]